MRILLYFLLIVLCATQAKSNQNNIQDIASYYKITQEMLAEFGLEFNDENLSFIEFNEDDELFKRLSLTDLLIDATLEENFVEEDYVGFSPRFAVTDFDNGTTTYFRDLNDFRQTDKDENIYDLVDELICLEIDWIEGRVIRLWYEPTDDLEDKLEQLKPVKDQINGINGLVSSVQDDSKFNFKIYPNPVVGDNITIEVESETDEEIEIRIFNMNGNERRFDSGANESIQGNVQVQLGVSKLESGMYLIQLKSKTGVVARRLIIAK
jgi:Secretion system C-terminal sorting domain